MRLRREGLLNLPTPALQRRSRDASAALRRQRTGWRPSGAVRRSHCFRSSEPLTAAPWPAVGPPDAFSDPFALELGDSSRALAAGKGHDRSGHDRPATQLVVEVRARRSHPYDQRPVGAAVGRNCESGTLNEMGGESGRECLTPKRT